MNPSPHHCVVAIVGCGTVGSATAEILLRDHGFLSERTGSHIELRYITDRSYRKARARALDEGLYEPDFEKVLGDEQVNVVVELVGGIETARSIIVRSLSAGKHVVTANKALLAQEGAELFKLARESGVTLGFEASCGGGIPIIRSLYDGLIANRIEALFGIVNGTCNFILTEMIQRGLSYKEALALAQERGFAEADPELDVSGHDTAHKIAIMSALAFGHSIKYEDIPVTGIDTLSPTDLAFGRELGYVAKLLAMAVRKDEGLSIQVRPVFITLEHPLAWVSGPFNAVSVYGHITGHTMYYGRGAGGSPTASAVVADIAGIASGVIPRLFSRTGIWPDVVEPAKQLSSEHSVSKFYLSLQLGDHPGALARIARILGEHDISIASLLQRDQDRDDGEKPVPVVITVRSTPEGSLTKAIREIAELDDVAAYPISIPIIDEHAETI
jgi:homoserine dehydrogenase